MQPLDDRTTCYTLIFWYFETADPTRPDPRVDPTRVQLWCGKVAMVNGKEDVRQDAQDGRLGGVTWPEAGL